MNEGLHLARKSGTALSRGEYILFLIQMMLLKKQLCIKSILRLSNRIQIFYDLG